MRRMLFGVLIVFLGIAELQPVVAQSDIWNCSRCGRRVWDSDSGRPRPSSCPYCSGGGRSGSMPIPQNWNDVQNNVGQSLGNSFMQGFQQGLQNNQAAQQEAARRAAEAAAAAERRRQELLQKAAEEARQNWEQQDAANMAEFGNILSSKKRSAGGLSPLLMKQAQQSSGAWNDPNVVDLRDITNRIPRIPGSGTATPFGSLQISGPPRVSALAAPVSLLVIPPPAQTLSPEYTEQLEFFKEKFKELGFDYVFMALEKAGPTAISLMKQMKNNVETSYKLTTKCVEHLDKTFDIVNRASARNANFDALAEDNYRNFQDFGDNVDALGRESIRGSFTSTSDKASVGGNTIDAMTAVWRGKGRSAR